MKLLNRSVWTAGIAYIIFYTPTVTTIMDPRSTIFTVAAVAFATGLAAYAVYFDYKRRNDVDFRRKLSK